MGYECDIPRLAIFCLNGGEMTNQFGLLSKIVSFVRYDLIYNQIFQTTWTKGGIMVVMHTMEC